MDREALGHAVRRDLQREHLLGRGQQRHRTALQATAAPHGRPGGRERKLHDATAFTGDSSGWLAGGGGALSTTSNGGATWTSKLHGRWADAVRADAPGRLARVGPGRKRCDPQPRPNGSSWSIQASGTTQTLRGLAASGSRAWAVGAGGAILTYSPDVKAPVTTTAGLASDGYSHWTNAARKVTLTEVDAGRAGVAATYYTVDGGGQLTYSSPFTVAGAGTHTITYWSADQAGNVEAAGAGTPTSTPRRPPSATMPTAPGTRAT